MCQQGTRHPSPGQQLREGLKHDLLGDRWKAVRSLEDLLLNHPDYLETYGQLSWLHTLQGNLPDAIRRLEQLVERKGDDPVVRERIEFLHGEPDRIAAGATDRGDIFEAALSLARDASRTARESQRQALILFRRLWAETGEESGRWVSRLAFALQDFPTSLEATNELHRLHPDDFEFAARLGLIHEHLAELVEAIRFYRLTLRIDPTAAGVHANLAALGAAPPQSLPLDHPLAGLFREDRTVAPAPQRSLRSMAASLFRRRCDPGADAERLSHELLRDPRFEPLPCNLCGGSEFAGVAVGRENGWPIFRCAACGLIQTHPQPTQATLTKKYQEQYYGEHSLDVARSIHDGAPIGGQPMTMLPRVMDFLIAHGLEKWEASLSRRRMLDVGCGEGVLMRDFRIRGWECEGTEVSSPALAFLRERGYGVHEGLLDSLHSPAGGFQLATMSHVIEHVRDPLGDLRRVHRLLAPGGWLFVTTPGADSLPARLAGPDWFYDPDHIFFFSRTTLRRMVQSAGFEVFGEASYVGAGRETWEAAWVNAALGPTVRRKIEERNEGDVLLLAARRG